ncbi:DUF5362 family protein [Pseudoleptotrichia goodfellowii]|uniref:DUF5362 domain-containing protein n=1 Tax=Pseudoleptotrichia goodfellowii TaxID=157692 RepID=A0A510JCW6_9FUSO|nr:DUF5362 family protein [Pseudoleptotrichia goodfellowii]BBM36311.1 hypothetical protein JCM16774_1243 [Pseudoleptotrichia goodfellowii]
MTIEDDVRKKLNEKDQEIYNFPENTNENNDFLSRDQSQKNVMELKLDAEMVKALKFLSIVCKIFGVFITVGGVIYALFLIGIPLIFIGIKVYKTGEYIDSAIINKNGENLRLSILTIAKAIKYYLILYVGIIALMFFIFFLIMSFGLIAALLGN